MPPRWMQSKLAKLRKARKTYPKWIRSGGVNTVKSASYDIFNNQQRVRTVHGPKDDKEPAQNNTFMRDIPDTFDDPNMSEAYIDPITGDWVSKNTITQEKHVLRRARSKELSEVRERSERTFVRNELCRVWSGKRGQGISVLVGTTIEAAGTYKLVLHFSGSEFVFVQTVDKDRWISKTYTRDEAYEAYHAQRIAWIQHDKITD